MIKTEARCQYLLERSHKLCQDLQLLCMLSHNAIEAIVVLRAGERVYPSHTHIFVRHVLCC